jgi:hypothetical protein
MEGRPGPQRRPGGTEEGQAGHGDGRQGDRRRDPVQRLPRRLAHAGAGPDGEGDDHHVQRAEAGEAERSQEPAALRILGGAQAGGGPRRRREAEPSQQGDEGVRPLRPAAPAQGQAMLAQRHAGFQHVRLGGQRLLDEPDAGAAMEAGEQHLDAAHRALRLDMVEQAGAGVSAGRRLPAAMSRRR